MHQRNLTRLDARVSDLAEVAVRITQHARTFISALTIVVLWAIAGPMFGYSDTWQLAINTGTTIVTFLLGFLTQHALSLKHADHTDQLQQRIASLDVKLDQVLALVALQQPANAIDLFGLEALAATADLQI